MEQYFGLIVLVLVVLAIIVFLFESALLGFIWRDGNDERKQPIRNIYYFFNVYFVPIALVCGIIAIISMNQNFMPNLMGLPEWLMVRRMNWLIFGSIAGLAAVIIFFALFGMYRAAKTSSWPTAEGIVEVSEIHRYYTRTSKGRSLQYAFRLLYKYTVNGAEYQGNTVSRSPQILYGNRPYIWFQTKRYPVGGTITVHYNPDKHYESVLEAKIDWLGTTSLLLHGIFIACLGIGWVFA